MAEPIERGVTVRGLTYVLRATEQADGSWRATVAGVDGGIGDAVAHLRHGRLGLFAAGWSETADGASAALNPLARRIRLALAASGGE